MNKTMIQEAQARPITETVKVSLIASLYVTVTIVLAVISFGAIQVRLSEMFNYLALFHKRNVWGVTLGVVIANFLSPTWVLDVPIGSLATFLTLILCRAVTKRMNNMVIKMAVMAIIFTISMFTIAIQMVILLDFPFFYTWFTIAVGELLSMTIGGVIIHMLSKKINLSK